jgi:hypothetical protein
MLFFLVSVFVERDRQLALAPRLILPLPIEDDIPQG